MRSSGLVGILGSIVKVVVAGAVGSAGAYACGGTGDTTENTSSSGGDRATGSWYEPNDALFADDSTFACESPLANILANLKPVTPVDYLELREVTFTKATDETAEHTTESATKARHGTVCATATNRDACVAAVAAASLRDSAEGWRADGDLLGGFMERRPREFLIYSRGDEVGVIRRGGDVTTFLGSIDTLEEARLVLQTNNLLFSCTTTPERSGWRRNTDGDWEFIVVGLGCYTWNQPFRVRAKVFPDGAVKTLARDSAGRANPPACGRRPDGLVEMAAGATRNEVAAHFARAAYLEAASVIAFRRLELELRRFGAPKSLVERARRSRADEIRHARETTELARRLGATVPPVDVVPMATRDVFACALENETEGCVRETYGALMAGFQTRMAAPELRPMLQRIAIDEAKHAELAHDVARFLRRKLTASQRAELDRAREKTLAELRVELTREPSPDLVAYAGVPTAEQALALLDGLEGHLLAA